ncbi:MAG TPA: hypothetical protein DDY98_06330 [Ruminococcaceae bacterium]|nr:hypothetical protein [Oscillospiraceae bacterium]
MDFLMEYGVDIGLVAVLIVAIFANARKGFVRAVLTLAAVVLAFGFAQKAAEPVASWSYDTFFNKAVCEKITEKAADFSTGKTTRQIVNEVSLLMPQYLGDVMEDMGADLSAPSNPTEASDDANSIPAQQISDSIVKPAAMVLLKMVCTLLCFAMIMALFRVLIHFACKVVKLPVLRTADRALGGVLGLIKGIIIVYLLSMLCGLVAQVTVQPQVKQAIEQSKIVSACQQMDFSGNFAELFDKNSTE